MLEEKQSASKVAKMQAEKQIAMEKNRSMIR